MTQPLLIYKNGRFTEADPVPAWYPELQVAAAGEGDLDDLLAKVGFERAEWIFDDPQHFNLIDVTVYRRGDVFYAMCSDCEKQLWQATFGWEDWPSFLAQFVVPAATASNLCELRSQFDEYLIRNYPRSPQARDR